MLIGKQNENIKIRQLIWTRNCEKKPKQLCSRELLQHRPEAVIWRYSAKKPFLGNIVKVREKHLDGDIYFICGISFKSAESLFVIVTFHISYFINLAYLPAFVLFDSFDLKLSSSLQIGLRIKSQNEASFLISLFLIFRKGQ